jgi:hypothetical protein
MLPIVNLGRTAKCLNYAGFGLFFELIMQLVIDEASSVYTICLPRLAVFP